MFEKMLLKSKAAAASLDVCERTLWGLTVPRGPIPAIRVGGSIRYSVADLRDYIDRQRQGCSSQPQDIPGGPKHVSTLMRDAVERYGLKGDQ